MPVLNRNGEPLNSPDEPLAEWAFRMLCLLEHDWRSAEENVYVPLRLDQKSRIAHGNLIGDGKQSVAQRRHANKGLSMELCAAGTADKLDRPAEVWSFCALGIDGRPNNFAPGGVPDVVADYGSFLVVIEASAKKRPSDDDYRGQLESGLNHAESVAREWGSAEKPCFCLIVNERSFEEQGARRVFRDFIRLNGLPQPGGPHLVPLGADAFAELAHWAHGRPEGSIRADGIAAALSEVAELCLLDDPPEGEGWMLKTAKERLDEATPQLKPGSRAIKRGGGWKPP